MGTWDGKPFGNDAAADWVFDLDEANDWVYVLETLTAVSTDGAEVDAETATAGIAAAEVVAHGLGRPTQVDGYTEAVTEFVERVGRPDADLVDLAVGALAAAASDRSELAELWAESDPAEWNAANRELAEALQAGA